MRVAILGESSADEAALRVLVDAALGIATMPVAMQLMTRGWPAVRNVLPVIIKTLHYRTDAEGLVVVVDSNHTSVAETGPKNRLADLRRMVDAVAQELAAVPSRLPVKTAVGVACPAIEAWFLCKKFQEVNEGNWEKGLKERRDPYSKVELKKRLYDVELPTLELERERMVEAANELCSDLSMLERQFPIGFGGLAQQLRAWRRISA